MKRITTVASACARVRSPKVALLAFATMLASIASVAHAQTFTYMGDLTASDPTQIGRVFRDGIPSTIANPKSYPGTLETGTAFHYDVYGFTNLNPSPIPVFIALSVTPTGSPNDFSVAYLNSFSPTNVSQNYLADAGGSASAQNFSFTVGSGKSFFVDVSEAYVNQGNPYSLTVSSTSAGLTQLATLGTPGPIAGAGLVPLLGLAGAYLFGRKRLAV